MTFAFENTPAFFKSKLSLRLEEMTESTEIDSNKNTTKILSWDVGIKNLAYCMLRKDDDNFEILKWGVINLVEDRQKCEFQLRTGDQCSELAKVCVYHTDKTIDLFDETRFKFSCTKHKEKMIPKVEKITDLIRIKTKFKNENKIMANKCCLCGDDSCYVLSDTQYCWCDKHYEKRGISFIKKIRTKKVTVVSATKQPIQELAEKLFLKLDKEFTDFVKVDRVIIENQPSLRNPTMKTLSSILYSYFIVRGITDKVRTKSNIEQVRFVSPSNKLKVNASNTNKVLKKDSQANTYKMTKKLGIKYCKALISDKDQITLDKFKKKDDMCDAFLQGFQHLFNPVPNKHFKKLEEIGFDNEKKPKKINKKSQDNNDSEKS